MNSAEAILAILRLWGLAGAAVALVFLTFGIDRVDPDARGAYVFRPLLVPAILMIWPLVLWRWWVLETGSEAWARRHRPPRRAHFWVALALALLIPATLITALSLRQTWPADFAPQRLTPSAEATE